MADYYPLLVRALEGLAENGREERDAIYERARGALLEQLRSVHPPLSENDITRERLALDEAIDRVENEAERGLFDRPVEEEPEDSAAFPEAERASRGFRRDPGARPMLEAAQGQGSARERPKVDSISPSIRRPRGSQAVLAGAALLILVAGIAVAAWFLRDQPGATPNAALVQKGGAPPAGGAVGAAPDSEAKFSDRVSGGSRVSQAGPNPVRPTSPPGGRNEVAVAQRAVLMEENPADPKTPKVTNGRAVWRLENVNAGQGQPLESVIRADIEVPDASLSVTMQIRRNLDPTLPASHTVLLTFRPNAQDRDRVIKDVGLLQFKNEESLRGTPVAGLPVPVKENVFLIGLSDLRGDVERNIDLITRRNWIDLPIRTVKGQRAILSFEKGVSGEQVVNDALRQWGQL